MTKLPAFGIAALTAFALSVGPVLAVGRDMRIINRTGFEIVAFFAAHKGISDWGEDRLMGQPIGGDDERLLDLDDGSGYCLFNFRAIFDDGEELVSEDINVCDLTMFTYY